MITASCSTLPKFEVDHAIPSTFINLRFLYYSHPVYGQRTKQKLHLDGLGTARR